MLSGQRLGTSEFAPDELGLIELQSPEIVTDVAARIKLRDSKPCCESQHLGLFARVLAAQTATLIALIKFQRDEFSMIIEV